MWELTLYRRLKITVVVLSRMFVVITQVFRWCIIIYLSYKLPSLFEYTLSKICRLLKFYKIMWSSVIESVIRPLYLLDCFYIFQTRIITL